MYSNHLFVRVFFENQAVLPLQNLVLFRRWRQVHDVTSLLYGSLIWVLLGEE